MAWYICAGRHKRRDIRQIYEGIAKAVRAKNTQNKLFAQGIEPSDMTHEQFAKFVGDDIVRSAKIVKQAGIHPD